MWSSGRLGHLSKPSDCFHRTVVCGSCVTCACPLAELLSLLMGDKALGMIGNVFSSFWFEARGKHMAAATHTSNG